MRLQAPRPQKTRAPALADLLSREGCLLQAAPGQLSAAAHHHLYWLYES
jgi:hypothetical protein